MTATTIFNLEVNPRLPPQLARMEELANNLLYSWDRPTRQLFSQLDPKLNSGRRFFDFRNTLCLTLGSSRP